VEVIYHPLVKRDVAEALKYYTDISARLADEFQTEVREIISQAADNPLRFHPTQRGFRRANLRRFPYHILYEVRSDCLRVMHVRHHKRHPDYGMERV
jgi:plasmid stabilization system protein ParE